MLQFLYRNFETMQRYPAEKVPDLFYGASPSKADGKSNYY